jgi:hypothetical protein
VGNICNQDQKLFKAVLIRGLKDLHNSTPDSQTKLTIKNVIKNSVNAMAPTCDSSFNCDSCWVCQSPFTTNVHKEVMALVLIDAWISIQYPSIAFKIVMTEQINALSPPANKVANGMNMNGFGIVVLVVGLFVGVLVK